ncbi:L-cystine transporter [Aneurinibacillus thermoaerophilus]|uniref:L-cystine uptake protein TcyP n=1 Tax=Aneurinibacillus thermoaerophilus TaxID=143495 RepID=A0A1G8DZX9_ANETH|nr:L-cystine transporter [Aneurinibacillus thermoaerophilus]MED0677261.1 L-cystine transporter [Aneurinibacillus thermoaerophilus]MED0677882.1 L-cystine transporter [Aneurinibacillus thermoaerophilus]MED0758391.1 L-cystine transporter [Aneurinibacillus thermoaerophilus]MED0760402.1 L-cystine transporter [Aneurinibacillus thermoaerophilus]MED0764412.1 L-cystine transporter [Aneurinibacillus thermoaerophilus]
MTTFLVIVNVAFMLLFITGLYIMQKKHISFSKRVFTALGVGVVFGLAMQFFYGTKSEVVKTSIDWFNIVGTGYVKLLQMIVMPLVFISILSAFTKLKLSNNIGKISGIIIGILVGTTAIAAAIGIATSLTFNLEAVQIEQGDAEITRATQLEQKLGDIQNITLPQKMVELLPENPFMDLTGARPTSTIAVVIFAAIIGLAFLGVKRKNPEQADIFAKIVETFYTIIIRVVTLVLRLTPYGILALMTKVTATSDYNAIWKLGKFVVASYVALIIMLIIHLLLLAFAGLNPMTYVKKALPVLIFAFTSRTSAGALPLNVKTQTNELGVPEGIANFAGSFGLSIGQNGCAGIYPAMLAVMIAPTAGIDPFTPSFILTLILVVAISSFGVAGVGGGATFAALLVLSTMNLPVALAGLLISVEPLIDMGRTALNVSGSMTAGLLTSKITKELDANVFAETKQQKAEAL